MKLLLAIAISLACVAACDGGDGTVGPTDGAVGAACGGRAGATCAADQYCDFGNNRCGSDDGPGRCMPRPTFCPTLLVPERTCGCDGRVYSSACDVTFAGSDLDETGACTLDQDAFVCGYRQCKRRSELCQRAASDVGGEPDGFTCRGLPASCGTSPSCACLAGEPCGDRCDGDAATGFTLTCPGG